MPKSKKTTSKKTPRRRRKRIPLGIDLDLDEDAAELLVAVIADFVMDEGTRGLASSILGVFLQFDAKDVEALRYVWEDLRTGLRRRPDEWPETDGRVPLWFEKKAAKR